MERREKGAEAFSKLQQWLSDRFVEREEAVEGAVVALGCGQHVLLLGPPGTGKSMLVRDLCRALGVRYFEILLTKFSKPEEVFGPISLKGLESDEYRRVTAGKLPEAEVAFVDEVFRASSAILNALLTLMNERVFSNDGVPQKCPLVSLFGASNNLPEGDEERELSAFADRFLLRYQVGYVSEDSGFEKMLSLEEDAIPPEVSPEDFAGYRSSVSSVSVPAEAVEALTALRRSLAESGVVLSDRRWKQSLGALKAKAALAGAGTVSVDRDFDILSHVLWTDPSQKATVSKVVRRVVDPLLERVAEAVEEAEEIRKKALETKDSASGVEANKKLKALVSELEAAVSKAAPGSRPRVERAVEKIRAWNAEVLRACLGI